jgi:hypothetical protein
MIAMKATLLAGAFVIAVPVFTPAANRTGA